MDTAIRATAHKVLVRSISGEAPKYFTREETKRILSPDIKTKSYRAWFLCLFLYSTGMRVSEVLSVRVRDFNPENRVITVKTLKRKKDNARQVPVSKELACELTFWSLHSRCRPSDFIFDYGRANAYSLVRRSCAWAGLTDDRAHPHTWRHTYAITCLSQGVPITVVRRWMGHRDLKSTLVYMEILDQDSKHFIDQIEF